MTPILGITASSITSSFLGGDFESIATVTVGAGGAATITFSSIPSTFQHLQLRAIARTATTTQDFMIYKPNNSNLSARHFVAGSGTSASAGGSTTVFDFGSIPKSDATADSFGTYVLDILDYRDTNKNSTLRQLGGDDLNGSGNIGLFSGLYNSTTAITSLIVTTYNGTSFSEHSHFALYGIK